MIVSPLQGIGSLGEQRSEDDPTNAWQGTEDGHVILLYSLSRGFRVLVIGNRLGEFFALPLGGGALAVDEPQLLGTGSLAFALSQNPNLKSISAIDFSPIYIEHAKCLNDDPRIQFQVGDA